MFVKSVLCAGEVMPPVLPPAIQLTESKIIPVVESLFLLQGNTADRHVSREIFLTLQKVCWFFILI